jgi:hypothetical protein
MKSPVIPPFALLTFLMMFSIAVNAQPITANLLYYLPIIGNTNDVSGNGYHATSTAPLTADRYGNPNSAIAFNGSAQSIVLPNLPQLKPELPMSVSFYAYFDVLGSTVFSNDMTPYVYSGMWIGTAGDGSVHLNYGDGGTTSPPFRRSKSSAVTVGTGSWHHFVGVIRAWNDMDIYIDCINAGGSYSGSGGLLYYSSNPGQIGVASAANQPGGVAYMQGKIDEIAFWDRALDANDVFKICKGALNELVVGTESAIDAFDMTIAPNPASERINVSISGDAKSVESLELVDLQGKTILEVEWNGAVSTEIQVGDLAVGMYFLRGNTIDGKKICKKFIVAKQ